MEHLPHSSPEMQPATPETAGVEHNYRLMTEHYRTDGSFKSAEQLRTEYVRLIDNLVHKMTDGVEVKDPVTGEVGKHRPDYVVWLDKSARPVAWLTSELWPTLASGADGNVPAMPQFKFVNIDRERWINKVDPMNKGSVDVESLDKGFIRGLRSIFVRPEHKQAGLTEDIETAPSELDGKTLLIVDEVKSSGNTLRISEKLFQRAFPTAKVAGAYWMSGQVMKGAAVGNADLPVWYRSDTNQGRGVGPFDPQRSSQSASSTQRLGGMFLSTAVPWEDPLSRQLRQEVKWLGDDVRNGRILVMPSLDRVGKDFDERVERFNHMTVEEFVTAKQAQDKRAQRH